MLIDENGEIKGQREISKICLGNDIDTMRNSIIICDSQHLDSCLVDLALRSIGSENIKIFIGGWEKYVSNELPDFTKGGLNETADVTFHKILQKQDSATLK